ncbi:hypothetical protein [Paracoccus sp. (in: a-proteobacteria)]|uniref:hypothetical protein n=1 Tax=Paracoccus sp. TaxID=267 RepID=UPI002B0036FE|nr:hypothetical protein [Paracoccus sp. (in: a-proteobacteria)]
MPTGGDGLNPDGTFLSFDANATGVFCFVRYAQDLTAKRLDRLLEEIRRKRPYRKRLTVARLDRMLGVSS